MGSLALLKRCSQRKALGQPETEITRPGSSAVNWNCRSLSLCTNAGFFYMARSLDHSLHNSKWTRCAAGIRLVVALACFIASPNVLCGA